MKKNFTKFSSLVLAVVLQLLAFQALAQTDSSRAVLRVTIDGVASDYLSEDCGYGVATFGGGVTTDLCAPVAWAKDNVDSLCCNAIPAGTLTGKVALIRRGTCGAGIKALNAQKAGAVAVLVANNSQTAGQTDCSLPVLTGGSQGDTVTIPVMFICRALANKIDAALAAGKAVQICMLPPDIFVSDAFFPFSSLVTPASQIPRDTFGFYVYMSNKGAVARTNIKLQATVNANDGTELFKSETVVPSLDAGVLDSQIVLPTQYPPELGIGTYFVNYKITADPVGGDVRPTRVPPATFYVSQNRYAKETGITIAFRPGTVQDYYVGNVYRTAAATVEKYKATIAEFQCGTNSGELPFPDVSSTLYLFRIKDTVPESYSGFNVNNVLSPSMTWVGTAVFEAAANAASYSTQQVELLDFNTGDVGVPLDNGARYMLVAGYTGASNVVFHAYDDLFVFSSPMLFVSSTVYTDRWYLGGWQGRPNAALRMYIDLVTTADEKPLPESTMKVMPNPVRESLNLAINFEKPTDATVTIADMNGRVITYEDHAGLMNETLRFDLPQLANGLYLARIATKEGSLTKKFVVQK